MQISLYKFCRALTVSLFIGSAAAIPFSAHAQNNPIPVENFFKSSQISNVMFSPDGKNVAMLAAGANDRLVLAVMEVDKLKPKIVAGYEKTDVVFFNWVNNQRLVFGVGDRSIGDGDRYKGSGLFAINKDGNELRELIATGDTGSKFRVLNGYHNFLDVTHVPDSNDVYITRSTGTRKTPSYTLMKLNTLNGYNEIIQTPTNSVSFMIDKSGEVRVAETSQDNFTAVHYKDPATQQWRKLIEYNNVTGHGFSPAFIAPDGQFYVTSANKNDTVSVYRFDLEKNKLDDTPVVATKGFDFQGNFVFNKKENKLLGVHYESDAYSTLWLDDKWNSVQKTVDAALPNTANLIWGPESGNNDIVIVHSFSDVHPGSYMLFNTETKKFVPIGDVHPEINSKTMSYKDFVRIKVRDGMEIPAYITLPKNSSGKNLPMVVMVHGGPYVRGGHWEWNRETQFLASRGYAVLEPDFRGSTGYGTKLFRAGWKQWGLAMQDDVTDATKWAIAQGYADPQRICIAGASYGGYATLMGLIKEPDLYRCGISWVGVTDINYLFDVTWSDTSGSAWTRYGMPLMIGDQTKDAEQLKATSPVAQAHRLTKPLILAYGVADRRVPLVHGEQFKKAAPKDAKIEWITYPNEGHGWRTLNNNVDFWTRAEQFLNENTAVK